MVRKIDAPTNPSLLIRLRNHDDTLAWSEFSDVYSPLIYAYCRQRQLQGDDSADIAQEVLLRISKAIRNFEYDRSSGLFRDWVARIVQNEINRFLQQKRGRPQVDSDAIQVSTDGLWNENFHQYILKSALQRIRPKFEEMTWTLFTESWLDKKDSQEVAAKHLVSISNVYVARSRVLKKLRYEVAILTEDSIHL